MRDQTGDFKRALVALDGRARTDRVLPWIRRLILPGGEIHLLTVLPPGRALVTPDGTVYADQVEDAERLAMLVSLGILADRLRTDGVRGTGHVRFGEPVREIVDMARDIDVDVIAMTAARRRPWWRWLSEGVTERVVRRSRVPVLIAAGQRSA
jgi:nucleotide-binding universal stress UspA family protein